MIVSRNALGLRPISVDGAPGRTFLRTDPELECARSVMSEPLWAPDERRCAATALSAFCSWLSARTGKALGGYRDLHRVSIDDPAEFWSALWDFTRISGDKGASPFL